MVKEIQVQFFEGKDYCHMRMFNENDDPIWSICVPHATRIKSVYKNDELVWVVKNKDIEDVLRYNDAQFGPFLDKQGKINPDKKPNVKYINEKSVRWLQYSDNYGRVHRCFNLNRYGKFFDGWMNLDCPPLELYETNEKDASQTILGECIPVFSNSAIEVGTNSIYVDSALSVDDVRKIAWACFGSWTGERLMDYVKSRELPKEDIDAAKERVEAAEKIINSIIGGYEDEILSTVRANEPDKFCCDCGWLNWSVYQPESLKKDLRLLKDASIRSSEEPKIEIGIMGTQSTIAQSAGAKVIQSLLKDAGYELSFQVHLD